MVGNNLIGSLVPQSFDTAFTNFKHRFNLRNGLGTDARTGPMRSTPIPFAVVGNSPAIVVASQNPNRKGLMMKNLDLVDLLYVGFGTLADTNGFSIEPGQTVLLDFVCPTDAISVFSTANIRGFLVEFAPIG